MAELSVSDWNFHKALNFSLGKGHTCDFTLKVKQLEVIKAIVQQNQHVLAALHTGYSKNPHTRTCGLRTPRLKFCKKGAYI